MKKLSKVLLAAAVTVLAFSMSTAVFAASQVANDITTENVDTAGAVLGNVDDKTHTKCTLTTLPTDSSMNNNGYQIADEAKKLTIKKAKEAAKAANGGKDMNISAAAVKEVFDVTGTPNTEFTLSLNDAVAADRDLLVLHKVGGTNWQTESFEWADNTRKEIKMTWGSFSPIALVEYKAGPAPAAATEEDDSDSESSAAATTTTVPSSPKTGAEFPMAAVVVLAALAGAAFCVKKFAVKE